jgi:hypothetical protein
MLRHKKRRFGLQKMEYLGCIVPDGTILISTKKVETVGDCPLPTTQKEIRCFVQFCNLHAKFIHHSSDVTAPLSDLLQKSQP